MNLCRGFNTLLLMLTGSTRYLAVLVVTAFLLCLGGQAFACVSDVDCHCTAADTCHHCDARACCHSVVLPAGGGLTFPGPAELRLAITEEMKLPLVLESILLPPKR